MESLGTFVVFMGVILVLFFSWLWISFLFIVFVIISIGLIYLIFHGEWKDIFWFILVIPVLYFTFPYFLISVQILFNILTTS